MLESDKGHPAIATDIEIESVVKATLNNMSCTQDSRNSSSSSSSPPPPPSIAAHKDCAGPNKTDTEPVQEEGGREVKRRPMNEADCAKDTAAARVRRAQVVRLREEAQQKELLWVKARS